MQIYQAPSLSEKKTAEHILHCCVFRVLFVSYSSRRRRPLRSDEKTSIKIFSCADGYGHVLIAVQILSKLQRWARMKNFPLLDKIEQAAALGTYGDILVASQI